jgi:hypothetical protein
VARRAIYEAVRLDNDYMSEMMKMTTSPMEKILGKGAFERKIPGTRPGGESSVRYVSFDDSDSIPGLFDAVVGKIGPPLVKSGGVVLEGTRLKIPDGTQFLALEYHGDIEGWQKQIEHSAGELGRSTARVLANDILVSDGRSYPLSCCEVEFH